MHQEERTMKPRLTPKRIEGLKAVLKILDREDIQADPDLSADLSRARDYLADLVEDLIRLSTIRKQAIGTNGITLRRRTTGLLATKLIPGFDGRLA
jgi:hypothetical protein